MLHSQMSFIFTQLLCAFLISVSWAIVVSEYGVAAPVYINNGAERQYPDVIWIYGICHCAVKDVNFLQATVQNRECLTHCLEEHDGLAAVCDFKRLACICHLKKEEEEDESTTKRIRVKRF